jgi:TRAF3-interacting protein 1
MSEEEAIKKAVEKTKEKLGPIINNPKLMSDKLLSKPPVKFIQMIVAETMKATGYPEGLFTQDELKQELKDKDQKLEFLKKLLNVVAYTLKKNVAARPMKIAAGLEPDKTNIFFTMLADAAANKDKYPWKNAVERIKSGKYKDVTADAAPSSGSKPGSADKGGQKTEEQQPEKEEPKQPEPAPKQEERPVAVAVAVVEKKEKPPSQDRQRPQPVEEPTLPPEPVVQKPPTPKIEEREEQQPRSRQSSAGRRPSPREEEREETTHEEEPDYSQQQQYAEPRMQRPSTARRAPPKLASNIKEIERGDLPTEKKEIEIKAPEGIITHTEGDDDDDGIIIDAGQRSETQTEIVKGNLVNKLMGNQSVVPSVNVKSAQQQQPARQGGGIVLKGATRKDKDTRDTIQNEIGKLRIAIQTVCQKTNPLGKTMDFIQEDLDAMTREHDTWAKECTIQRTRLMEERAKTAEALQASASQLADIEQSILEKIEKIHGTKAIILKNDMIIENLLRNVVA